MNDRGKLKLLPLLPGVNVNEKIGQINFHKPQHFEKQGGVFYLANKPKFSDLRYPPIYASDDRAIPTWIAFDGQRLEFKAYFEEETGDGYWTSTRRRIVNLSFFLEDGTMKICEPFTCNSGMEQGVLVKRQKIPVPDQIHPRFYEISDLNIGKQPIIFGRTYLIFDCDKFTRSFLTRLGIPVPNPIPIPSSWFDDKPRTVSTLKKPHRKPDTLGKFLKYDRQVLRFYGYWDDTESPYGIIHDLEIYYYLADDTIEIKEVVPQNLVKKWGYMYIKKTKMPKIFTTLNPIGADEPSTLLNIIKKDHPRAKNYFVLDPLNTGEIKTNYYTEIDFFIGAVINVYGRKVVITNLDSFTKDYYKKKYGIEEFVPINRPDQNEKNGRVERQAPPYNGFGSYEDSLGNCFGIVPKPPKINFIKFHCFGDHVLRFRAKMISEVLENAEREFIIRFYLMDDTISVFELSSEKLGFKRHLFQNRMQVKLPGQDIYTSDKPKCYDKSYFYVGARLNLNGFIFELTSADMYALRYMEQNYTEFEKSNPKLIMQKFREAVKSVYKEFIKENSPDLNLENPIWDSYKLRSAFKKYLGDKITEQEIITIARKYSSHERKEFHTREYVRALVHNELKRFLWNKLDRLEGNILHFDRNRRGFLERKELYTILRGSQVPLNIELLNSMLDHIYKNEEGRLDCRDLLNFMNLKIDPPSPVPPLHMKTALWWASEKAPDCGTGIDWRAFLKDLDLEGVEESLEVCLPTTE